MSARIVREELAVLADPDRATHQLKYFRATPGGYGYPDEFLGIPVPAQRKIASKYWREINLTDAIELLESPIHEHRLTALFLLARLRKQPGAVDALLARTGYLNNWDLTDTAGPHIVGPHLLSLDPELKIWTTLTELSESDLLWDRRLAMVTTQAFIRVGAFTPTLVLAERLLSDGHDLIAKVVGWMLREVGDRDRDIEEAFLQKHHAHMQRVALRYAIEKFPPDLRRRYLAGEI